MKIGLSWLLFTAESAGALIILWNGVPIHRRLLLGHTTQQADPSVFVLGAVAVILIQSAYWIRFIGGLFGVVFFTRFEQLEFSIWKVLFLMAVLFSLFCYMLDLDRLGKAFWEAQTDDRPRSP
ncbi:MAG: hypothetical protein DME96_05065 [Verrucomicrobia bacterium]|nr:MAG: hypothetical protein DME96_05065 [Verrucomicrobiota bacterium]